MKYKISVEISNIEVSEGYYSFDYIYILNGKVIKKDNYESDYSDWTEKKFKKYLEDDGALNIVFTQLGE